MHDQQIILRDSLWRVSDGFHIIVWPMGSQPISLADIKPLRVAIDGVRAPRNRPVSCSPTLKSPSSP